MKVSAIQQLALAIAQRDSLTDPDPHAIAVAAIALQRLYAQRIRKAADVGHIKHDALLQFLDQGPEVRDEGDRRQVNERSDWEALDPKLRALVRDQVDAHALLTQLLEDCEEFRDVRDEEDHPRATALEPHVGRIGIVWHVAPWSRGGATVFGTAKARSTKQRELDPDGPWWIIELNLAYWLLCDEYHRMRLLHHECGHLLAVPIEKRPNGTWEVSPRTRMHDLEEFASTVARFGLLYQGQASVIAHAMSRPEIRVELGRFGFDLISGQGLLFEAKAPRSNVVQLAGK